MSDELLTYIHPATKILRKDRKRIPIRNIRKGNYVKTAGKRFVKVLDNIKYDNGSQKMVSIAKGALGKNRPNKQVFIHFLSTIKHNGKMVQAMNLVDDRKIKFVFMRRNLKLNMLETKKGNLIKVNNVNMPTKKKEKKEVVVNIAKKNEDKLAKKPIKGIHIIRS